MTHRTIPPVRRLLNTVVAAALILLSPITTQAAQDGLVRHTVVKGDTLWSLANQYLDSPWLWPELWEQNNSIDNPNLIYPGDVLLISSTSIRAIRNVRLRTVKLEPKIHYSESERNFAITTIDPEVILPFLSQSIVVSANDLDKAAYVLQGTTGSIVMGRGSRFYARGIMPTLNKQYQVFREGRQILEPDGKKSYGFEGVYLGNATLVEQEDGITTLEITRADQEIRPGDRLRATQKPELLPYYFPRKPNTRIDTRILMIPKGVHEAGRRDIVIISGGDDVGLKEGHVLEVFSEKDPIRDPITSSIVHLPAENIGTLIVFSTFAEVSYAILMESTVPAKIGDRASTP